jgi:hypothetical protein
VARDRGDIAGARARYQEALNIFRQGASDRRCTPLRTQFLNAAATVERNIQWVSVAATPSTQLVGSWRGCDGRVVTFVNEGGGFVGRYTALGGLPRVGFTLNEIGYRARLQSAGRYVGDVKWRWPGGRQNWVSNTITISGNSYRDTGSDSCSRSMTRIR